MIFMFPVVAVNLKSGGSSILAVLFLLSLIYAWPAWSEIDSQEKKILLGFSVFVAWAMLTLINTDDMGSAVSKMERFARIVAIVPIYLFLRRHQTTVLLKAFLYGSVLSCFVFAVLSWYEYSVMGLHVVNGVYHKIVFGDAAVFFSAIVALGLICFKHKKIHYLIGVIAVFAGFYAIILSATRGAWLSIPFIVGLWIWLYRSMISRRVLISLVGAGAVSLALLALWTPAPIANAIARGMDDLQSYKKDPTIDTSLGDRLKMWTDSVTMFKQHPFLGVGIGDYKLERVKLMEQGMAIKGYPWGHAHSIYFHALATTGLMGLLLLVFFFFTLPFLVFYRQWFTAHCADLQFAILCGLTTLVGFAVFGLTEAWLSRNPMINIYTISICLFLSSLFSLRTKEEQRAENPLV